MRRICAVAIGLTLLAALLLVKPGLATADSGPTLTAYQQTVQYVMARALSQRGVPFVWGGGNAFGPTRGRPDPAAVGFGPAAGTVPGVIPGATTVPGATTATTAPGAGTVGFDASGLVQYAFAGAGLKLPRSSGEQYSAGRKVTPAQARPGDLIFYGPNGSQSVAIFLGNGQMIEATEPVVTVSPVRTSGMSPYLVREIGV